MEPSSTVHGVSFKKVPWQGQRRVFDAVAVEERRYLNIQLPTGYGKTFTAAGAYAIKHRRGTVNRLLVIFPSDTQLTQFEEDSKSERSDLVMAGVPVPHCVKDIRFSGVDAIRSHRSNSAQLFVVTIQALIQPRGADAVRHLLENGRWMIVVDEYHHYGIEQAWGRMVRSLPCEFLLAMSATPKRRANDSAFGDPHITVSYRDAREEGAVKPLRGHAYSYRIDTIDDTGSARTFTTDELLAQAGGDGSPETLERWRIERKMRWSPKYVSPLVSTPIERMGVARLRTGCPQLQVLIGALCVSHAELVCEQVRAMFPELKIDWVGTGPNGRSDAENAAVLRRYCPPKDAAGVRHPTLDVLVHVGMAGEGLDSPYVVEVVHLNRANLNNANGQENGRAARRLLDAAGQVIEGNINFDTTSPYAAFVGAAIEDAMDGLDEPRPDALPENSREASEPDPLPDEPAVLIVNMELEYIDSGDPGVQRTAAVTVKCLPREYSRADLDASSPRHTALLNDALTLYRDIRRHEAEAFNDKSVVLQWQNNVSVALSAVVGLVIRRTFRNGQRPEKSLAGDLKRRVNGRKKAALGEVTKDVAVYRKHYQWLVNLDKEIRANGLPTWLS